MSVSFTFRPTSTNTVYTGPHQLLNEADLIANNNTAVTIQSGALAATPIGAANGLATLDGTGKIPSSQLPVASLSTYHFRQFTGSVGSGPWVTLTTVVANANRDRANGPGSWNASGHFVAGEKGIYLFTCQVNFVNQATSTFRGIMLQCNGNGSGNFNERHLYESLPGIDPFYSLSMTAPMESGGVIIPQVYQNSPGPLTCTYWCSVIRIGTF